MLGIFGLFSVSYISYKSSYKVLRVLTDLRDHLPCKNVVRRQPFLTLRFTRISQQTYRKMNTTPYAPRIPIREYLVRRGILPRYERNGYGMYLSPLREERTPSFKVNYQKDLWYDFGIGEGGTLLALIMRLERCSRSEVFEHLQHAAEGVVSLLAARICERYAVPTESPNSQPVLRILSDAPLRHPALLGYLTLRGIVPRIAAAYCREVRYQVRSRRFFAIGFRNDCGGWELRSERFKGGSSPKHITTIDNRSDTVIAFEGFMDFLAYLSLKHPERLRIDAAVLNSVVNLPKAIPFLSRHPVIHAFFDNDEAGRKTTSDLIRLCPRSEVIDQRHFYSGHKDVNDYLIARIKGRTQKPSTQKNAPETKALQTVRNNLQPSKAETTTIEPPRRKGVKI